MNIILLMILLYIEKLVRGEHREKIEILLILSDTVILEIRNFRVIALLSLLGCLVGYLVGSLLDCLVGYLGGYLVGSLPPSLPACLLGHLLYNLTHCLVGYLLGYLPDCQVGCLLHCLVGNLPGLSSLWVKRIFYRCVPFLWVAPISQSISILISNI